MNSFTKQIQNTIVNLALEAEHQTSDDLINTDEGEVTRAIGSLLDALWAVSGEDNFRTVNGPKAEVRYLKVWTHEYHRITGITDYTSPTINWTKVGLVNTHLITQIAKKVAQRDAYSFLAVREIMKTTIEKREEVEVEIVAEDDVPETLVRTGDQEAKCPGCGNENAMLNEDEIITDPQTGEFVRRDEVYVCRDCGYKVTNPIIKVVKTN